RGRMKIGSTIMANEKQTYAEQVAAFRAQRRQQELSADYHQAVYGREEALRNRQDIERQSATSFDDDERAQLVDQWHYYDAELQRCEADMQRLNPQRQQADPRMAEFVRRRTPFVQRHGAAAYQAMDMAHRYATAPRNPHPTPEGVGAGAHGMGLQPNTQAYFDAMDSLLTMYAKDYGLRYDPDEKLLTANQACKMSGIDANTYNRASKAAEAAGMFSWQRKQS